MGRTGSSETARQGKTKGVVPQGTGRKAKQHTMANTNTTTAPTTTVSCLCCGAKCNPAFLSAGYCRKAKCQKAQSQSTTQEDQTVTTTPKTVTDPVPALQPVDTSKDTGIKVQAKPHAGNVSNPVQGPLGTVQVYTHEETTAGLIYTPATVVQALEYVVNNTTGRTRSDAVKLLAAVKVKPADEPYTVSISPERAAADRQLADDVQTVNYYRTIDAKFEPLEALLLEVENKLGMLGRTDGQPFKAWSEAVSTVRETINRWINEGERPAWKRVEAKLDASKLDKAVERGIITQQEADAVRAAAKPAAAPAPGVNEEKPAPAPVAAQTTANSETAKLDKPTTTTTDKPAAKIPDTMPTTYKALTALGGDVVKLLAAKLEINADGLGFAKLASAVWAKIKPAAAPKKGKTTKKPETEKKPATKKPAAPVVTEKKPAPAAEPAAPVVHKAGTVLVADGKGGVREATEADLWAALEAMAGKKVAA